MKWFKHLVDSGDDPDINAAVILFGPNGYYVFFRTLEIMSREFDYKNPGQNTFFWGFFRKKFRISARKLRENLEFFNKKGRILSQIYKDGNVDMIDLNCPKLRNLSDEHTRKVLGKSSGVSQELVRNESHTDNRLQITDYKEQLRGHVKTLKNLAQKDKIDFRPMAFFSDLIKNNSCPPLLAVEVAEGLIKSWSTMRTNPYALGKGIFATRKQNHNEKASIAEALKFKKLWIPENDQNLKQLLKGVGK